MDLSKGKLRPKKILEIFEKHDTDGSGLLSVEELQAALKEAGRNLSPGEVHDVLIKTDKDGDMSIDPSEFITLFDESRLLHVFQEIDTDMSGSITVPELAEAFAGLDILIPEDKLTDLLTKVDYNSDGSVTFEEFEEFFRHVPMADLRSIADRWANLSGLDTGSDLVPSLPSSKSNLPLWQFVLAGGIGGTVSRTATAPLEFVKLKAQISTNYRGMFHEWRSCFRAKGVAGLYAGNGANCLRIFPHAGLGCLAYSRFVKWLPSDSELDYMEFVWRAVAGAGAGATATLITYPLDTVRARLTVQPAACGSEKTPHYNGIVGGIRRIFRDEGAAGFYKGLKPTLLAVAPFVALQQATYDVVKQGTLETFNMKPSVPLFMSCGAIAAIIAQSVVYPLDLIRRRMQAGAAQGVFTETYLWFAAKNIVEEHGPKKGKLSLCGIPGLFRGILPTFLKVMPAVAISVTARDAALGRLS